jgi:hypothetical protein
VGAGNLDYPRQPRSRFSAGLQGQGDNADLVAELGDVGRPPGGYRHGDHHVGDGLSAITEQRVQRTEKACLDCA